MFEKVGQSLSQVLPSKSGTVSLSKRASILNCPPEAAIDLATVLLGCYRKSDCDDPEVFLTAASAVLSHYPEDVARAIADPRTGIAAKLKWFPTIYEIREACDIENARRQRIVERDASLKEQFAERDRIAAMDAPERRRAFIKREMAAINAAWIDDRSDKPRPPIDIRGMAECAEKDGLRGKLNVELERASRVSAASDLRLSAEALLAIGVTSPSPLSAYADTQMDEGMQG